MEITEEEVPRRLVNLFSQYKVPINCLIESNNGGRGFTRAVQKEIKHNIELEQDKPEEEREWSRHPVKWVHQSENKMARILVASSFVMNHI